MSKISLKSLLISAWSNALFYGVGSVIDQAMQHSLVWLYLMLVLRLGVLHMTIMIGTANKPYHRRASGSRMKLSLENTKNVALTTLSDTAILYIVGPYVPAVTAASALSFPRWIMASFAFELILDFFHYWGHRLIHESPQIYSMVHKRHHEHAHPTLETTFHQDPLDLLFTNVLPFLAAFYLVPPARQYIGMLITCKSYTEMSGHVGKRLYPSSCFPQFVWLPRFLGIELYAEDHHYHHTGRRCNYSKRFSLWDKVFLTYHRDKHMSSSSSYSSASASSAP